MVSVRETTCEGQGQSLGPAGTTTVTLFLGALSREESATARTRLNVP